MFIQQLRDSGPGHAAPTSADVSAAEYAFFAPPCCHRASPETGPCFFFSRRRQTASQVLAALFSVFVDPRLGVYRQKRYRNAPRVRLGPPVLQAFHAR